MDLVNLSVGTLPGHAKEPLADRCRRLAAARSFIVAAGHNRGLDLFLAAFDSLTGVGLGRLPSPFHLVHRPERKLEFVSQGRHEAVPWLGGAGVTLDASSFAAPILTGIAALLVERYRLGSVEELRGLAAEVARVAGPAALRS